jgi:hypothetical protein
MLLVQKIMFSVLYHSSFWKVFFEKHGMSLSNLRLYR